MNRFCKILICMVLTVALVATPVFGLDGTAGETDQAEVTAPVEESVAEEQDGDQTDPEALPSEEAIEMAAEQIEEGAETDATLEMLNDPEFYKYNDIDEEGNITPKPVREDTSNANPQAVIDKAVSEANAAGITSEELAEAAQEGTALTADGAVSTADGAVSTADGAVSTASAFSSGNTSNKGSCLYLNCVDVSWWQHDINWNSVKAAGIECAIVRCGYSELSNGSHEPDSTFVKNVNGAYAAGLKVGTYYYSTAKNKTEATAEANYVLNALLPTVDTRKLELPIVFDYETGGRLTTSVMRSNGYSSCVAFCDTIKNGGYTPMVYANYSALTSYINGKDLDDNYKIWLAQWSSTPSFGGEFYAWQYTSSGRVNGISGNVDMNYIFEPGHWKQQADGNYKMYVDCLGTYLIRPGWLTWVGQKYYLDGAGNRVHGYVKLGSYNYGFDANGVNYRNRTGWFGQYGYKFDSSGRSILNKSKIKKKAKYYAGPGTKYKKKGTYKKGKKFDVLQKSGKWSQLSSGYWVKTSYLTKMAVYPTVAPYQTGTYKAKIKKRTASYSDPSTGYVKKKTFSKNKKVTVVGTFGSWAKLSSGQWVKLSKIKTI